MSKRSEDKSLLLAVFSVENPRELMLPFSTMIVDVAVSNWKYFGF
jgi:hypothetical protein